MKTLLILGLFVIAGYILVKVIFPIFFRLFKFFLAAFIPAVLIVGAAIILFIGAAAFVGLTQSPNEDGGPPLAEQYEGIADVNEKIENKIDSMEGGRLDTWIRKQQDKINSK